MKQHLPSIGTTITLVTLVISSAFWVSKVDTKAEDGQVFAKANATLPIRVTTLEDRANRAIPMINSIDVIVTQQTAFMGDLTELKAEQKEVVKDLKEFKRDIRKDLKDILKEVRK
jgi:hypothetical protein